MFFHSKNGNGDPTRDSVDEYLMPLVEIEDFNAIIDNKPFFDQPGKNNQDAYEKLIEMSRNNDCVTENLLDFSYHQSYHKLIAKDLRKIQVFLNKSILQEN